MGNIKMLYFDRIENSSEGINVNETSASKGYDICHYWFFLNEGLGFNHMCAIDVMIYQ